MAISFRDVGGDGIDEHISTGIFDWDELDLIQSGPDPVFLSVG